MVSSLDKLHYSFCGELKNNVSLFSSPVLFPSLALFKVDTNFASNVWSSFAGSNFKNLKGIKFIDDLVIKEVEGQSFSDVMQGSYMAFIAPRDFLTATNKKEGTRCYYYDEIKEKLIFQETDGQSWFKQQPHLIEHATFQLFFLDGMLGTYNLGKMDYEIQEGKVIVNYLLVIKATPSGILFKFQSGEVSPPIRWNLAVKGSVVTMRVFQALAQQGSGLWKKIKNPLLKIGGGIAGGLVGGPAGAVAGAAAGSAVAGSDNEKSPSSVELNRGIAEAIGFNSIRGGKASEEQHTNRLIEQVGKTSESISDPTLYYTNNIDYHFNFFDFWMRLSDSQNNISELDRILMSKIVFSSVLFNNLKHNNNANPITYPLNITFEKLGYILKPGRWKGELVLDYDPNGRMAEAIARGATFYNDKKEHFVNPNLGVSQQHSFSLYSVGGKGDNYIAQAITSGDEPWINEITRTKGTNFHQRAHFFITYEDSTNDHWLVLFPQSFTDNDLANGHHRGGFDIKFDKPVKEFIDVYTCIGCGAVEQGYTVLHSGYDSGGSDSLDTIHKGLPYEPWFSEFTRATNQGGEWKTPSGKCLGQSNDVWEFTGQYIRGKDNKAFTEAYGFIPSGGTIQWTTKGGTTRIEWQKVPNQDDFSNLDWSPPAGSGGEIEIPLEDPEIAIPEPGEDVNLPEDEPVPDPFDPSGGEIEMPAIEIDLPPDIDPGQDPDDTQDIDPPPIEPDVPEVDPNDPDIGRDPDTGGDHDPPPDFPIDDDDAD